MVVKLDLYTLDGSQVGSSILLMVVKLDLYTLDGSQVVSLYS